MNYTRIFITILISTNLFIACKNHNKNIYFSGNLFVLLENALNTLESSDTIPILDPVNYAAYSQEVTEILNKIYDFNSILKSLTGISLNPGYEIRLVYFNDGHSLNLDFYTQHKDSLMKLNPSKLFQLLDYSKGDTKPKGYYGENYVDSLISILENDSMLLEKIKNPTFTEYRKTNKEISFKILRHIELENKPKSYFEYYALPILLENIKENHNLDHQDEIFVTDSLMFDIIEERIDKYGCENNLSQYQPMKNNLNYYQVYNEYDDHVNIALTIFKFDLGFVRDSVEISKYKPYTVNLLDSKKIMNYQCGHIH